MDYKVKVFKSEIYMRGQGDRIEEGNINIHDL